MERSKDFFIKMLEAMRQQKDELLKGFMAEFSLRMNDETRDVASEETFEVTKGQWKTVIVCKFDKEGRLVDTLATSDYIPSEGEKQENERLLLQKELELAVEKEDYLKAAEIKSRLSSLRKEKAETKRTQKTN